MNQTPYYPAQGLTIAPGAVTTLLPPGLDAQGATVLFIHAHPDDESSSTGATIGALTAAGVTVHLLTMTRGEMGEVINPALKHLEAEHPGNTDQGRALGQMRTDELRTALKHLGVSRHLFLGEGASAIPSEHASYRDSGMVWDSNGRAAAHPSATEDSLTRLPIKPQAQAVAYAIREMGPDVVVTYDSDGGYGHPDHKRTYEAVMAALATLRETPAAPRLVWGIEGEFDPADVRPQAVIRGDLAVKREAMRAHATQIIISDDTTFEYSNRVPQPISDTETYRLLWGNPAYPSVETVLEEPVEAPGPINSAVTSIALGLLAGFVGTMYHAHIWYPTTTIWVPWGALLAILTVYCAATWAATHTEKNWAAALVGATAFTLICIFAFAKEDSILVYINPINAVGATGTLWALGSLVAATLAIMSATRHRRNKT
ncbi:PIG-L family deacetylase [Rothia nasisuis]|uniref:PIG-L family deacetylase n=1 Tax=Rothia nasisuis TaxID=2109647 RepID=UPI001F3A1A19|nr:PIG-L family deacetylase [Rothia nasisuis]